MARRYGWPDEIVAGVAQFESLPLDERTKMALRFAERMTQESNRIDDEFFAALRQQFDEGEIVEIGAVVGLFNYFNRFNNALRMEPTKAGER